MFKSNNNVRIKMFNLIILVWRSFDPKNKITIKMWLMAQPLVRPGNHLFWGPGASSEYRLSTVWPPPCPQVWRPSWALWSSRWRRWWTSWSWRCSRWPSSPWSASSSSWGTSGRSASAGLPPTTTRCWGTSATPRPSTARSPPTTPSTLWNISKIPVGFVYAT